MTKTIGVKFANSSTIYSYLTDDETIKVDDCIVVESPASGYTIVKVNTIQESADSVKKANKWIVSKVDDTAYKARLANEKKKALLEAKLEKAVEVARKQVDYDALAKLNPDIADLVSQLKAI